MSKHGNNNAKHVLRSEAENLRWFAAHLLDISEDVDGDADLLNEDKTLIIDEDKIVILNGLLMKIDSTRRDLTTIIPKEYHYEGKISRTS